MLQPREGPLPTLQFDTVTPAEAEVDGIAVFATKHDGAAVPTRDAAALGHRLGLDLAAELAGIRYEAEEGTVARIPTRGEAQAAVLLVVGLGDPEKVGIETMRKAAGVAARNAARHSTLAIVVPGDVPAGTDAADLARAVIEGAGLGAYAFTAYRSKQHDVPSLEVVRVLAGEEIDAAAARRGVDVGAVLVRATNLARDLVNEPPGDKRPPALADRFADIGKGAGLKVRVHDEQALEKGAFGGILGVGRGSSAPPRLVELAYEPSRAPGHVVLVGKGITFDSGGLSLKPSQAMASMKADMSGAAAVVAAMSGLRDLGVRVRVTGLMPLAENMPSGTAMRVSDVITQRGGKTVEVMNTDAEGRLVLADALAYGAEMAPDAMVDIATLTGAQVVALGKKIAGLMGSDDALVTEIAAAAEAAGEQVWRLPLPHEYAEQLKSEVADLKNIGKPQQAGTLIGGLFLKEFAGDVPWAHLDIAGPAFSEEGDGFYTAKGGTGMGVRTLLRFLLDRSE
jgi:leucyl aminopeptidase